MKGVCVTPFRSWNTEPILIVGLSRVSVSQAFYHSHKVADLSDLVSVLCQTKGSKRARVPLK